MKSYECPRCVDIGIQFVTTNKESYDRHLNEHHIEDDIKMKAVIHAMLGDTKIYRGEKKK